MRYIPLMPASLSGPAAERRDAARNRERLLAAARELIAQCGVESLTMDRLAEHAGVGKGTVFRRFGSRTGLMMTLLSDAEAAFQAGFMFGPPPLGPGASAVERVVAFGVARIAYVLEHGDLVRAADSSAPNRFEVPAALVWRRHVEILLREAGMQADPAVMAMALISTLEPERLLYLVRVQGIAPARLAASWQELVTRVMGRP